MRKAIHSILLIVCLIGLVSSPANAGGVSRVGHGTVQTYQTVEGVYPSAGVATLNISGAGTVDLECAVVDPSLTLAYYFETLNNPDFVIETTISCEAYSNRGHSIEATAEVSNDHALPAVGIAGGTQQWTGMNDPFTTTVCVEGITSYLDGYGPNPNYLRYYERHCAPVTFTDSGNASGNTTYCQNEGNNELYVPVTSNGTQYAFVGTDYDFGSGPGSGVLVCAAVAPSSTGLAFNAGIGGITAINPHVVLNCSPARPYSGGTGACVIANP